MPARQFTCRRIGICRSTGTKFGTTAGIVEKGPRMEDYDMNVPCLGEENL
jgi:hypothetical protein